MNLENNQVFEEVNKVEQWKGQVLPLGDGSNQIIYVGVTPNENKIKICLVRPKKISENPKSYEITYLNNKITFPEDGKMTNFYINRLLGSNLEQDPRMYSIGGAF